MIMDTFIIWALYNPLVLKDGIIIGIVVEKVVMEESNR
jgi:hypothetical protein